MKNIQTLWIWFSVDEEGNEGITAFKHGDAWHPLVTADPQNAEKMDQIAHLLQKESGIKICKVVFMRVGD